MFWYRSVVSAHDVADQCHYLCKSVMVWTDNASNHLIHNAKLQSRLSQTEDVIFLSLAIVLWILNVISITLLFSEAGCEAAMMMMVIISWWSWRQGVWSLFQYHGHIVLCRGCWRGWGSNFHDMNDQSGKSYSYNMVHGTIVIPPTAIITAATIDYN